MTKAQFLKSPQGERAKYLFMRHPLTILFGYIFVFLHGMCIYPFLNHPRKHYDCLIALVVHVVIGVMLTFSFGWQALLLTMAWFTGNIGYHHIHHLNARIPFYRLPEVMKKIPELQTPKTTSLNPMEIIRCLRLKVWDVESQRMVVVGHI